MKTLILPILILLTYSTTHAQQDIQPAVILISSASTPAYIGEMKDNLRDIGLVLNVEREKWKNREELEEFAFTLTNVKTKKPVSFSFKYNELNKHQIFLVYPLGNDGYGQVMADVSYLRNELLPIVINNQVKKMRPILHRSFGKSGMGYRESIVMTDLKRLEQGLGSTIDLYKTIKADQAVGKSISGITYTYNGEIIEDPAGINLMDMTSDVLIETLSDHSRIINIWSEAPLNELIMNTAVAGQR